VQWNANVQRTFGRSYLFEVAYTGSKNYNEHKRFNINQARPGTTPIETRVPYPQFQSAILYSSDGGYASFHGVSFRIEKRYASGLFFLANYQLSRNIDNGSGEIEANDTAFAWDLSADEAYSRYDQRHRSAFSWGYELPFGPGKQYLSDGGLASHVLGGWQVQGVARFASGFRSRSPRRTSAFAGRSSRSVSTSRPDARRTKESSTTRRSRSGSTGPRTSWPRRGRREPPAETPFAAPDISASTSRSRSAFRSA
jgi:hypothetical protein